MTQDDSIRMAREAGLYEDGKFFVLEHGELTRFAAIVAATERAAEREVVAHWMRSMGYATGHGDTMEDLLDHLGTQISEKLEVEALIEREACAKVCEQADEDGEGPDCWDWHSKDYAAAIRARSKK